jgi:hypothetical protein
LSGIGGSLAMLKIPVLLEMLKVRTRLDEKKNLFTCHSIEDCCARLTATTLCG